MDLVRPPDLVELIAKLGYPAYLLLILGTWKVLGAAAILAPRLPRLKEWAYAGMVFDLVGAVLSHGASGDPAGKLVPPLVILGLVVASWRLRPESRKLADAGPASVGPRLSDRARSAAQEHDRSSAPGDVRPEEQLLRVWPHERQGPTHPRGVDAPHEQPLRVALAGGDAAERIDRAQLAPTRVAFATTLTQGVTDPEASTASRVLAASPDVLSVVAQAMLLRRSTRLSSCAACARASFNANDRLDHRDELSSEIGQRVLDRRRRARDDRALDHAVVFERAQPRGEHLGGDAGMSIRSSLKRRGSPPSFHTRFAVHTPPRCSPTAPRASRRWRARSATRPTARS